MGVALLKFSQGAVIGGDGRALVVVIGATPVIIENSDNAGVGSYKIELLYAPPDRTTPSGYSLVPGVDAPYVIASGNGTPNGSLDMSEVGIYGCYRIRLTVWPQPNQVGVPDVDIRNVGVLTPNRKLILPPYQKFPNPLPLDGVGAKPDELNFEGQGFGWSGPEYDAGTYPWRLVNEALREIDAAVATPPSIQTVWLGKHGSDANDGTKQDTSVLTLARAITLATALVPAVDNRVVIHCDDAGEYLGDGASIPSYVHLEAPAATFTTSGTSLALLADASANVGHVVTSGGMGVVLPYRCVFRARSALAPTAGCYSIGVSGTDVTVEVAEMTAGASAQCILISNSATCNIAIGRFILEASTSEAILAFQECDVAGSVGEILGSGTGVKVSHASAAVRLTVARIDTTTPWNVSAGALRMFVGEYIGTPVETGGTVRVLTPWTTQRTVWLGKHGSDSNDGTTPWRAVLTPSRATALAVAMSPTANNRVVIRCDDAGEYSEVSTINIPSFCDLRAPSAVFTTRIDIPAYATADVGEVRNATVGAVAVSTSGVNASVYVRRLVTSVSAARGISVGYGSESHCKIRVDEAHIAQNSECIWCSASGLTIIDVELGAVVLEGTGAYCIRGAGTLQYITGRIGSVTEAGAGVGQGIGIMLQNAGSTAELQVGLLACFYPYYLIHATSTLHLFVARIVGTPVSAGVAKVTIAGEFPPASGIVNDSTITGATVADALDTLGPGATWTAAQTVYLGKHGNDSLDGLRPATAVLTLAQALVVAATLSPAPDNRIVILCTDDGKYDLPVSGSVLYCVDIYAPNATFYSADGTRTLSVVSYSNLWVGTIAAESDNQTVITLNGTSRLRARYIYSIQPSGTETCVLVSSIGFDTVVVADQVSVAKNGTGFLMAGAGDQLSLNVQHLRVDGFNGVGIHVSAASTVFGHIGRVDEGPNIGSSRPIKMTAGSVRLHVARLKGGYCWDVTGGTLDLFTEAWESTLPPVGDEAAGVWVRTPRDIQASAPRTVHLGVHGDDSNDGTTPAHAVLTIDQAITLASALSPAAGDRVAIVCTDSGEYDAPSAALPQYTDLIAPGISINQDVSGPNPFVLSTESTAKFNIFRGVGGVCITVSGNNTTLDVQAIYANVVGSTGVRCVGSDKTYVRVGRIFVGSTSTGLLMETSGRVFAHIDLIDLQHDTACTGIAWAASGSLRGYIGYIHGNGGVSAGNVGIRIAAAHTTANAELYVASIDAAGSPWDVQAGELDMFCGQYTNGSAGPLHTGGTLYVMTPRTALVLTWPMEIPEIADPGTPGSGKFYLWADSTTHRVHLRDSAGTTRDLTGTGS